MLASLGSVSTAPSGVVQFYVLSSSYRSAIFTTRRCAPHCCTHRPMGTRCKQPLLFASGPTLRIDHVRTILVASFFARRGVGAS